MNFPDNPTQAKVRLEYDNACRVLALADVAKRQAKTEHEIALERYARAYGAAVAVGIVK